MKKQMIIPRGAEATDPQQDLARHPPPPPNPFPGVWNGRDLGAKQQPKQSTLPFGSIYIRMSRQLLLLLLPPAWDEGDREGDRGALGSGYGGRAASPRVSFFLSFPSFILFSFAASSSVGTPQLTRADRPSVLVRLHSVPSRSLEKSHPSFFAPLPLGEGNHFAYHVWNPHTDGNRGSGGGRRPTASSGDHGGKNYVQPTGNGRDTRLTHPPRAPPTHTISYPPPGTTTTTNTPTPHTEMPAENLEFPSEI